VGILGFFVFRSRRKERKELEKEQQTALVESFLAVSREASASRNMNREEAGERSPEMSETSYLPYRDAAQSRSSPMPLRQSGLSEATLADGGPTWPRTGL
jgi:hypothetical protein